MGLSGRPVLPAISLLSLCTRLRYPSPLQYGTSDLIRTSAGGSGSGVVEGEGRGEEDGGVDGKVGTVGGDEGKVGCGVGSGVGGNVGKVSGGGKVIGGSSGTSGVQSITERTTRIIIGGTIMQRLSDVSRVTKYTTQGLKVSQ